jgi:outer membrane protein assembly factor BamB
MVLGNERVISMWPARGGPVLKDGIIYFAAGVMPFEGVFIHAVDAATGDRVWTNSTTGTIWNLHQHGGAWSYGGPSPRDTWR